jgi:AmmeMemoRadiSam system protein B/AmmeMemoRadiSam system protein A
MAQLRAPCVAGRFYPDDPAVLCQWVDEFTRQPPLQPLPLKAVIAPHAGYRFSGPIAGSVYAAIKPLAGQIRRVVLLGPAHRMGFAGIAVPSDDAFVTPLGPVPLDRAAIEAALEVPTAQPLDHPFDGEHCLEVQLPFLQRILGDFTLVPMLVGDARPDHVEAVLEKLWGGPETLVVISSDLSHYQDYETANRVDLDTTQTIEALQPNRLAGHFACGFLPISGLLRRAMALDLRATTLDVRNSGDTSGPKDRVVGYGAFGFEYAANARLAEPLRAQLLALAGRTLEHAARTGEALSLEPAQVPLPLRAVRRTFVTLEKAGQLRGCIGSLTAHAPLVQDVMQNTARAALQDPRFGPVRPEELESLDITISILSHSRPMSFASGADLLEQLRPEVDGLILRENGRQALFLPKVWHDLPEPAVFVGHLLAKAGLPHDHISPDLEAFRFTAETFGTGPDAGAACARA